MKVKILWQPHPVGCKKKIENSGDARKAIDANEGAFAHICSLDKWEIWSFLVRVRASIFARSLASLVCRADLASAQEITYEPM